MKNKKSLGETKYENCPNSYNQKDSTGRHCVSIFCPNGMWIYNGVRYLVVYESTCRDCEHFKLNETEK